MVMTNNGEPYFLRADVAKAGQSTVSISNYLKMRVNDNGKILPVKWYDQNRVMNINGMIPFIEGAVGQFTTDPDTKEIIMASDAVHRDWQGSTANTRDGGWADYILTDQMFTQEGIFYGKIGLMNAQGTRLTSINVWFRVLGDDLFVSETTKYYSNLLENAKRDFEVKTSQVISDARNAYSAETKNTHDAAIAAKAEIDAVRESNDVLNQQIDNQRKYIDANNIVTRPELSKVQASIDNRLGSMQLNIQTYDTLDQLEEALPNGADGLFYVLDTGDQYIFDKTSNTWMSKGKLITTGLSKSDSKSLKLAANHVDAYNGIPNATFENGLNGWAFNGDPTAFEIDNRNKVDGYNTLHLNVVGKTSDAWYYVQSDCFEVKEGESINVSLMSKAKNLDGNAIFALNFYSDVDGKNGLKNSISWGSSKNTKGFMPIYLKGQVPKNAVVAKLKVTLQKNGELWFALPQTLDDSAVAFSHKVLSGFASEIKQKNVGSLNTESPNFWQNWSIVSYSIFSFGKNENGSAVAILENHNETTNKWQYVETKKISLNNALKLSLSPLAAFTPDSDDDNCQIIVNFFDNGGQKIKSIPTVYHKLNPEDDIENLTVPDGAVEINVQYMLNKNGKLIFEYPNLYDAHETGFKSLLEAKQYDPYAHQDLLTLNHFKQAQLNGNGLSIDDVVQYQGNSTIKIVHADETSDTWNFASVSIDVKDLDFVSIDVPVKIDNMSLVMNGINYAYVEYIFRDQNDKVIKKNQSTSFFGTRDFFVYKFRNIEIPDNAQKLELHLCSRRNGSVWFGKPNVWPAKTSLFASRKAFEENCGNYYDLPQVYLTGDYSKMTGDTYVPMNFEYIKGKRSIKGYASVKWQGASSKAYDKKNLKLKLFKDNELKNKLKIKPLPEFPKENTFVLKANWIDATQSRNLVNAELWKEMTLNRPLITKNPANFAIATEQSFTLLGANTVQSKNMYLIDNAVFNRKVTISFDLTSDVAQGKFEVHLTKPNNLLLANGSLNGGKVHVVKTIILSDDPNKGLPTYIKLITNGVAENSKVTVSNLQVVEGDQEGVNAEHPNDSINRLVSAPSAGAVQGFPVEVYINGADYGLYTFNTTHEAYLWNMDDKLTANYAIASGVNATYDTDSTVIADDGSYSLEVPKKMDDKLNDNFNVLLKFINSSTDDEFKQHAYDHFDVIAAIDTYLVNSYFAMYDGSSKSIYMLTYDDGKYWIPSMYDFDSTWGLYWDGSKIESENAYLWKAGPGQDNKAIINHLQRRVRDLFPELVKERWNYLKSNVFAPNYIIQKFQNFVDKIGVETYDNNFAIWPTIPSIKDNNLQQIQRFVQQRYNYLDKLINS